MVSDEALKKLQEQIAAWPITQRFVVQQLILDYLRNREDLRAYEDTGLTPEEFQSYAVFLQDLIGNQKASEALDRFRWLAEADKDGRVVVLPCKVGDTVYFRTYDCCSWEIYRCRAVTGPVRSKMVPDPRGGGSGIGGDEGCMT